MGFVAGCRAFLRRRRTCRPGYTVCNRASDVGLTLCDGTFLPEHQVSERIIQPILDAIAQIEQCYRIDSNG